MSQAKDRPEKQSLNYTWQEFTDDHVSPHGVRISCKDVASDAFVDQVGRFAA